MMDFDIISLNLPKLSESANKKLATLTNIQKIEFAEYCILHHPDAVLTEFPTEHFICNGTYVRQVSVPKGVTFTGKVHKHDHICKLETGEITVMTSEGITRIKAPSTWQSKAGIKRLIYVHDDALLTNIHRSDKTTVDELEEELTHDSDLSWIEQSGLLEN